MANQLDSFMIQLLATAKEQSVYTVLTITQQHRHLSVCDVLCTGQVSEICQFINKQVNSNITIYLQPFFII